MDDSFSLLGVDRELCQEAKESGTETPVKHFVFEDLLDTSEKLICYSKEAGEFSVHSYVLVKEKLSFFSRREEKELGCYLGYKNGSVYTFEDFNFKINSFEEFTLLTEAVEVTTGNSFYFELCNLCQLPEKLTGELDIALSIYTQNIRKIPPLTHFDQIADENRELLKLVLKGNTKAKEKLETEVGESETKRLIEEFKSKPEELFDTCLLYHGNSYTVIGIITSIKEINIKNHALTSIDIFSEEIELTVLTHQKINLNEGERIELNGRMFGIAAV